MHTPRWFSGRCWSRGADDWEALGTDECGPITRPHLYKIANSGRFPKAGLLKSANAALRTLGRVGFRWWVHGFPDLVPLLPYQSSKNQGALRIRARGIHAFGPSSVHTSVEIYRIERCHTILACRSGSHYLRELNVLFVAARPFSIPTLSQWLIDQRMNGMQANKTISALIHSMSILLEKGRRFDWAWSCAAD